jgi:hypothetical protein
VISAGLDKEISQPRDDVVGRRGGRRHVVGLARSGEHQDGGQARAVTAEDVGVQPIADHTNRPGHNT